MTGDDLVGSSTARRIFEEDSIDARDEEDDFVQVQRMEAIQAALSEIIASDDMWHMDSRQPPEAETPSASMSASLVLPRDLEQPVAPAARSVDDIHLGKSTGGGPRAARVPSARSSSGLDSSQSVGRRRSLSRLPSISDRSKLFDDFADVGGTGDDTEGQGSDFVQLAAPGNLHLRPEIARLETKIQDLVKQENLLEGLIRRADLTGNEAELKLLQKSISTVRRDLRASVFQKAQYEQQEEQHRLVPGRTMIAIPSAHVIVDEVEGKQVARYAVRISQSGATSDGQSGSWVVYRRYNQFYELDRAIRDWADRSGDQELMVDVRNLAELPGKKLGPSTSATLVESRRLGLERYLRVSRFHCLQRHFWRTTCHWLRCPQGIPA